MQAAEDQPKPFVGKRCRYRKSLWRFNSLRAEVPRADCMQRLSCEEWRRRRRCRKCRDRRCRKCRKCRKRDDGAVADPTVDSFDGLIDVYRMREVFPVSSVRGENWTFRHGGLNDIWRLCEGGRMGRVDEMRNHWMGDERGRLQPSPRSQTLCLACSGESPPYVRFSLTPGFILAFATG